MRLLWDPKMLFEHDALADIFENDTAASVSAPPQAPSPDLEYQAGKLEMGAVDHAAHFSHPSVKFKTVRAHAESANAVFHATTSDNRQYMIKPFSGSSEWHEPEHWVARNQASARLLDSMGKSHMGVETFHAVVPGQDRMARGRILQPDEDDSPEKRRLMHASHVGQPALVTKYANDTIPLSHATDEQLNKIDGHHRLAGIVHHVLMGNADGHHRNVLLNTKGNHPVHIDDDLSLSSQHQASFSGPDNVDIEGNHRNPNGLKAIMSVYGHGEDLDYRKGVVTGPDGVAGQIGEVGNNFPPEIMHTLHLAAHGLLGDGLSDHDHAYLIENARELIDNGLENTLMNRHVMPTYQRRDAMLRDADVKTAAPGNR